jgi:hypothetical protein
MLKEEQKEKIRMKMKGKEEDGMEKKKKLLSLFIR